jgi:hypothetical protein
MALTIHAFNRRSSTSADPQTCNEFLAALAVGTDGKAATALGCGTDIVFPISASVIIG